MKFFDSKEEVLDIQLTQYGRHRLSLGRWDPVYYSFFDDNILYDGGYGGVTEAKNEIEDRIQDETPLLRTQHTFTGRDSYLYDNIEDILDRVRLSTYEKMNVMPLSLGTSELNSTKTPAFTAQFLDGKITELQNNFTGSAQNTTNPDYTSNSQQLQHIPQIEANIEFKISAVDPNNPDLRFETDPALSTSRTYSDGATVVVGPDQIILLVEEENSSFDYKNFDIEVFEMTEQSGSVGEQVLVPLSFIKPIEMVHNGLLIEREEAQLRAGQPDGLLPEIDTTFVEYYFDVKVDEEIDENLICKAISQIKSKNLIVDIDFDCPDLVNPTSVNIYASDAPDEECLDI
tara:strand:+ start:299 stop:1330 length:1032 start_codon:yes stop_codon:yes gene_type:complete